MNTKKHAQSGFLDSRALIILLLCAVTSSIVAGTLLGFFRPETQAGVSQRTLTFEERVAYQRAIEEVYWRHRLWPKEHPDAKPSLDAVMSQAQLEKKVKEYLRNSQALEDYWQRSITAEQLQAEMDRMAQHTKQPEVLRELFEAPGERSLCHRGGDEITKTGPERRTTSNSPDASCCRWRYRPEANAMAATPQVTPRIPASCGQTNLS